MGSVPSAGSGAHLVARTTMPNTAMLRLEHSNSPASSHSLSRRGTNLTTFVIPEGDEVIHLDHKGALPLEGGHTHVLVVVCALTKFTLFIPVPDTKGETTFRALRDHVFSIFGYPLVMVADNGSAFANKLMKASERLYGYRVIHVMPHTPQANGLAEAAVKKLKLMLDRHTSGYKGWRSLVGTGLRHQDPSGCIHSFSRSDIEIQPDFR